MHLFARLTISIICLLSITAFAEPIRDVRILIDVSGSMKNNDPQNLRADALKMLVELLPANIDAGIWQFGSETRAIIPHGNVNFRWRANAEKQIDAMQANQSFTNLGNALAASTQKSFVGGQAAYILITDGKVDIGKDRLKNLTERNRILDDVVPDIAARGGKIYTIALSENADQQLLDFTAMMTGGTYALVRNSADIKQQLLKIFDQSLGADEIPILANRFYVDSAVDEFTALVFHDGGSIELMAPNSEIITNDATQLGVNWVQAANYSMVTIKEPAAGEWMIGGKLKPNSRVTVVSDVKLKLEALPDQLWMGEPLDMAFYLEERGGIVHQKEFLANITAGANLQGPESASMVAIKEMLPKWQVMSSPLEEVGLWRLSVEVDGQTFKRKRTFAVNVRAPLSLVSLPRNESYEVRFEVLKAEYATMVQAPMIEVQGPGVYRKSIPLQRHANGYWYAHVSANVGDGAYHVSIAKEVISQLGLDMQSLHLGGLWLNFPIVDSNQVAQPKLNEMVEASVVPVSIVQPMATEVVNEPESTRPWRKFPIVRVAETMPDMALKAQKTMMAPVMTASAIVEATPEPAVWQEEPVDEQSDTPMWLYLVATVVGLIFMVVVYLIYRRFEKSLLAEQDENAIDVSEFEADSLAPAIPPEQSKKPAPTKEASSDLPAESFDAAEPELDEDISAGVIDNMDDSAPEEILDIDGFDLAEEDDDIDTEDPEETPEEDETPEESEPNNDVGTDDDDELDAILDDLDDDFGDLDEELGDNADDDLDDLLDISDDGFDEDVEDDDDFDPLASLDGFDDLDDEKT